MARLIGGSDVRLLRTLLLDRLFFLPKNTLRPTHVAIAHPPARFVGFQVDS